MTDTEPGDAVLYAQPNLTIRQAYDVPAGYEIAWGEGSRREHFVTQSPELAACLITMPNPTSTGTAVTKLVDDLGLDVTSATSLVNDLCDYGYWCSTPTSWTLGEQGWLDVEWNDALRFHTATRAMTWSHDYSGDPKVMTRYHVQHNVTPETEPPTRYEPEVTTTVSLPEPSITDIDFHQLVRQRRTSRDFRNTSITLTDLATILSWTFKPQFPGHAPRHYATQSYSRGAPFPAFVITGLRHAPVELEHDFGVYHYSPERHELGLVNSATGLDRLDALLWRQSYVNDAPAMLVICADWAQYHWKYRFSRAYRFAYAECGAFMHTALLAGTALGLKTFQTPAIDDRRMCQTLGVADHEVGPIYIATFGRPDGFC